MTIIKNKKTLIENGQTSRDRKARRLALSSLEFAIESVDPRKLIKSKVSLRNSKLFVNNFSFDLKDFKSVYIVGAGKASGLMAEALEQILGDYIKDGIVSVPFGSKIKTEIVHLHHASHPIPDKYSIEGTMQMLEIAKKADKNDLVICLISGGGSSLMALPQNGISLTDMKRMTEMLLKSGMPIDEINTIRKHISQVKGGLLARKIYPATILNLILSDVVGDSVEFVASGPTVPDSTTFEDAMNVLKKYELWDKFPISIRKVLSKGKRGIIPETPKPNDEIFKKVFSVVIGSNRTASSAACNYLKSKGLNTLLLTTMLEGEARHVGNIMASIAREIHLSGNPLKKPAAIVAGGETTVTVTGEGLGGRNQELVLAAVPKIHGINGMALASMSSDGIDGPVDAAGAIADGKTLIKALRKGLIPEKYLAENNSYNFFSKLKDTIISGITNTNVNDICVAIIL